MSTLIPLTASIVGALGGVAFTLLGWYTGPAWSVSAQHIPMEYPALGAIVGWALAFGVAWGVLS